MRKLALCGLLALMASFVVPLIHVSQAAAGPPHVLIVLMENTSYEGVVGNSQMPYVNGLVNTNGSVSTTDLSHPSLPNYLGYVSGSIQNNPQDTTPQDGTYAGSQFTDELAAAGIAWKAYMQDMPVACDLTDQYGPGGYDVNHNPFMYFNSVRNSPSQCNRDVPYSELTTDLNAGTAPPFVWVTPNTTNDMHDGTPAQGDAFLQGLVTQVQASSWWAAGSRIVITWDEGTQSEQVLTLVVGSAHGTAAAGGNEYGTLRGLEEAYGVGLLGQSAASNVGDILPLLTGSAPPPPTPTPTPTPPPPPTPTPTPSQAPPPTSPPPSPTAAASPTPSASPSRSPSASPSPTLGASASPSPTRGSSASPSPTRGSSASPSPSRHPTASPSPSPARSSSPSQSPDASPSSSLADGPPTVPGQPATKITLVGYVASVGWFRGMLIAVAVLSLVGAALLSLIGVGVGAARRRPR